VRRLEYRHAGLREQLDEFTRAAAVLIVVTGNEDASLKAPRVEMLEHVELQDLHPAENVGVVNVGDLVLLALSARRAVLFR
jgi:hypothetical protein